MLEALRAKRAEIFVALLVATVGALAGGALSLAGVFWQSEQSAQQIQREAVEKFLDDYSAAFVEIEYFGNRRVPAEALSRADKEALRKQVRGVYAACTRLALVAPELADSATAARNVLGDWEKAITAREPYDRTHQSAFSKGFDRAITHFLRQARADLRLP